MNNNSEKMFPLETGFESHVQNQIVQEWKLSVLLMW